MKLVLLTHPDFLGSQSQSRLARSLLQAYRARGHQAELRQPRGDWRHRFRATRMAKWAGYVDQYLVFPGELRAAAALDPADTLYVFCDQALGPWMPLLAHRPHVVHCLDLMALRSALGLVPENPTGWTGRIYQRYIRRGFQHARHFISISEKTREDLHRYGRVQADTSVVLQLGLNYPYQPVEQALAQARMAAAGLQPPPEGFLLHAGGGQWYKNTEGVILQYHQLALLRQAAGQRVPQLWMVSPQPRGRIQGLVEGLPAAAQVRYVPGIDSPLLEALYATAQALLFPSLDEGFGWPIAEALACGCPVLTTGEAPMTEVGGPHAHYLPRALPGAGLSAWAEQAAATLQQVLERPLAQRQAAAEAGVDWAARYKADRAIDGYIAVYQQVLATQRSFAPSA
jgi:glycosyltransferase involved in cell wall biosynthesis